MFLQIIIPSVLILQVLSQTGTDGPQSKPIFAVVNTAPAGTKIGQVTKEDTTQFTYYIKDVFSSAIDSTGGKSDWIKLTFNKSIDDCAQVTSYPVPRNFFCVDHNTGDVFVTSFYTTASLPPGSRLVLKVAFEISDSSRIAEDYVVHITPNCSSYRALIQNCPLDTIVRQPENEGKKFMILAEVIPYYVVSIDYDLKREVKIENEVRTVFLTMKYGNKSENFSFPFDNSVQHLQLLHPLVVTDQNALFDITSQYENIRENATNQITNSRLRFNTLPALDYCTRYPDCISMTDAYIKDQNNECKNYDQFMFKYKFSVCNENPPPKVFNKLIELRPFTVKFGTKISAGDYADLTPDLKFKIESVTGRVGDLASFQVPAPCGDTREEDYPRGYFCEDDANGDLYATFAAERNLKEGDTYKINVKVESISYPYRKNYATITVNINDYCKNATLAYEIIEGIDGVGKCNPVEIVISQETGSFPLRDDVLQVLGFRYNTKDIPKDATELELDVINTITTRYKHIIERYNGQSYHYIAVPGLENNRLSPLSVKLYELKNGNRTLIIPTSVQMYYTQRWTSCNVNDCLNAYRNWKDNLPPIPECREDRRFFTVYYDICLDLKPEYVSPLYLNFVEGNYKIDGCQYTSIVNLENYRYLLFNETKLIRIPPQPRRRRASIGGSFEYKFLESSYPINSYDEIGIYQCLLNDTNRMKKPLFSPKFTVTLPAPIFLTKEETFEETVGKALTIPGCNFTAGAELKPDNIFWVKDGKRYQKITDSTDFTPLTFRSLMFIDSGVYQCAIYINNIMNTPLLSEKLTVNVTEVEVNFISGPIINYKTGDVSVVGCQYTTSTGAPFEGSIYLLLNGTIRIYDGVFVRPFENRQSMGQAFIKYNIRGYNESGFFQCAVYNPNYMFQPVLSSTSEPTDLIVPSILSDPISEQKELDATDELTIFGCKLNISVNLNENQTYWIRERNGIIEKLPSRSVFERTDFVTRSYFSNQVKVSESGIYKCGIHVEGLMSAPIESAGVEIVVNGLLAEFLHGPTLMNSESTQYLSGCVYKAKTNLNQYAYYLLNGTIRIDFNSDYKRPDKTIGNEFQNFSAPQLYIRSYDMVGTYQCVIHDGDIMNEAVKSTISEEVKIEAPLFTTGPKLQLTEVGNTLMVKVGGSVTIKGCRYSSPVPLQAEHVYWLKDGFKKIPATSTFGRFFPFKFNDLIITNITAMTQGFYQCVIYIPGIMATELKSPIVDLQITDVSATRVTINIDQVFSSTLNNQSSTEFRELKIKIENEVINALLKADTIKRQPIVEVIGFRPGSVIAITEVKYEKVSNVERKSQCDSLKRLVINPTTGLPISSIEINSLDCCFEDTTGEISFKGEYFYNTTLVTGDGSVTELDCTYNTALNTRKCEPNLEKGPKWANADLKNCKAKTKTTNDLIALTEVTICNAALSANCVGIEEVAANLSAIISNGTVITTQQDVTFVADILNDIAKNISVANAANLDQIANDVVDTLNNLLDANISTIAEAQLNSESSTSILKDIELFGEKIGNLLDVVNLSRINVDRKNIALMVNTIAPIDTTVYAYEKKNEKVAIETTENQNLPDNRFATIFIPGETFGKNKSLLYSFFYREGSLFQNTDKLLVNTGAASEVKSRLRSTVMATSIAKRNITNLEKKIRLNFSRSYFADLPGLDDCVFWDFDKGIYGNWSSEGCIRIGVADENAPFVLCECNHLTNFAILLDVSQTRNNPIELQIITWIGCGISLAGLLITVITFLAFRNLRKKLPPKILVCLCISLMLLLIIFLAGVEETSSREGCQTIAALLHYFILTTFFWMTVEGVNLYRNFVKIFKTGGDGKFLMKASVFAWVLPAIIVGITAGLDPDNLGNDNFCVVRGFSFYFAVLLPVAVILLGNFVVLILVMSGLSKSSPMAKRSSNEQHLLTQARVAFACSVLLGLTWVFAILAVGEATTFFQWLFCIFNSLQGFFIFLFYTVRNRDVRKEWRHFLGISDAGDSTVNSSSALGKRYELAAKGEQFDSMKTGSTAYG